LPTTQTSHVLFLPSMVEYEPATQSAQVLEFQAAATVEYVPELHVWQVLDRLTPVAFEYLPAEHASQFTPFQLAGGVIWPEP
jgi:hypothetical protein